MGRTFPLKRFKATKRPLVSTDCGVWKSVWSTAGKFMSVVEVRDGCSAVWESVVAT